MTKKADPQNTVFGAPVKFSNPAANDSGEATLRPFKGVAYGGGVIEDHWYWGNVAFDLSTLTVPKPLAALIDHDSTMRAGVITKSVITSEGLEIDGNLLRSEYGQQVASDSDDGFPWQMSVRIEPQRIDFIDEKTTIILNGQQVQGPLNIFRDSTLLEISFCATGWDRTTSAVAMSKRAATAIDVSTPKETTMTPEEIAALQARVATAEASATQFKNEATAATERERAAAEQAKGFARAARVNAVKSLLTEVNGAAPTDADVEPFIDIPEAAFAATSKTMRDLKAKAAPAPALPKGLFGHTATHGKDDKGADPDAGKTPEELRTNALQKDATRRLQSYNRSKGLPLDTPATF